MSEPFLRTAYNYDRMEVSNETGLDCRELDEDTGELVYRTMAQQHFAEECDINTIVRRFGLTGQLPVGVRMPTYGDFLDVPTYHEAMTAIRQADEAFMMMPADVRARFDNDAGKFVEFCSDEKNRDEAVRLGLVLPKVAALASAGAAGSDVPAPAAVAPVPPPAKA